MRFYRDLGLTEFYRRPVDPSQVPGFEANADAIRALSDSSRQCEPNPTFQPRIPGGPAISTAKAVHRPAAIDRIQLPRASAPRLQLIREDIGDCTRCALHKGRNKIVFGDGIAQRAAHVCGRRPRRRRRRAGPALCGPRRPAAQQHDRRHGPQARRGLHRQRGQVPPAGQPHSRAGRSQHLLAVSLPPDRRGAPRGSGRAGRHSRHLSARLSASLWPGCAGASTPSAAASSSSPITRRICCAIRGRRRKPGPTCRLPCANWA